MQRISGSCGQESALRQRGCSAYEHGNPVPGSGMEDLDDPRLGAKIFLICAQFQKCFCAALMEQAVKEPLIAIDQGIEFMGKSKHYMEVRGIYDFRPALIDPDFFKDSLAVGTVPVPAGILVEFHVPAFPARADIDTKSSGFAGKDCMGSFLLFF